MNQSGMKTSLLLQGRASSSSDSATSASPTDVMIGYAEEGLKAAAAVSTSSCLRHRLTRSRKALTHTYRIANYGRDREPKLPKSSTTTATTTTTSSSSSSTATTTTIANSTIATANSSTTRWSNSSSTPRDNYAKMASIESLDLASPAAPLRADAGAYSKESLEVGECLDDYFTTMKQKSVNHRSNAFEDYSNNLISREEALQAIFSQSSMKNNDHHYDDDTMTLGGSTIASTSMTVRTEPTLRSASKNRSSSRKKKKKSSSRRSSEEKKPKQRSYAQIRFDGITADVEYTRIPKSRRRIAAEDDQGKIHQGESSSQHVGVVGGVTNTTKLLVEETTSEARTDGKHNKKKHKHNKTSTPQSENNNSELLYNKQPKEKMEVLLEPLEQNDEERRMGPLQNHISNIAA